MWIRYQSLFYPRKWLIVPQLPSVSNLITCLLWLMMSQLATIFASSSRLCILILFFFLESENIWAKMCWQSWLFVFSRWWFVYGFFLPLVAIFLSALLFISVSNLPHLICLLFLLFKTRFAVSKLSGFMVWTGTILSVTIPALYSKYQRKVDKCCGLIHRQLSHQYKLVDENVISKLSWSLSKDKDSWALTSVILKMLLLFHFTSLGFF